MPNNIKTSYPKETKKLNHILTWILKRVKKKSKNLFKKCLRGFSAILFPVQNVITRNFFNLWNNFEKLYTKMFVWMNSKNRCNKNEIEI